MNFKFKTTATTPAPQPAPKTVETQPITPQPAVETTPVTETTVQTSPLPTTFAGESSISEPEPIKTEVPVTPSEVRLNVLTPETNNKLETLFGGDTPTPETSEPEQTIVESVPVSPQPVEQPVTNSSIIKLNEDINIDMGTLLEGDFPVSFKELSFNSIAEGYKLSVVTNLGFIYDIICEQVIIDNTITYKAIRLHSVTKYF